MKTVETIIKGETLLVSAKKVAGGKIQIEVAEIFSTKEAESAVSLLNASDDRFKQAKARRAWLSAMPADLKAHFGFELGASEEEKILNILNPKSNINGKRLRVISVQTTKGSEYQLANIETTAMRAGADGDILYSGGLPVFGNTELIFTNEQPKHKSVSFDKVANNVYAPESIPAEGLGA